MRHKKKQAGSLWFIALFACLVVIGVVIGLSTVLSASSLEDRVPTALDCVNGEENREVSCNEGADDDDTPLPTAQDYLAEQPMCCNIAQLLAADAVLPYRGVSLAGGEFRNTPGDDDAKRGEYLPFDNDAALFLYKGMNTFRVPITWEYFADPDGVIITRGNYIERLDALIFGLTAQFGPNGTNGPNATVIIELHNYMRFNPDDVAKNVENTNPTGPDVIGASRFRDFANLWYNIVERYNGPRMMYGIMNEPHDVPYAVLNSLTEAAYRSIRLAEEQQRAVRHLVLVSGNQFTGLHSWFDPNFEGISNAQNTVILHEQLRAIHPLLAIEVHQYFDDDSSGRYLDGDCLPTTNFTARFNVYWPRFENWAINNSVRVFLGEFGAPDTPVCIVNIRHLLDAMTLFAYSPSRGSGVIGWAVWAAGNSWGSVYPLSLAAGGRANDLMWNNRTYERYLVPVAPIPPIESETPVLAILNSASQTLHFEGGYLPFQFRGSPDIATGQTRYLYSNNAANTPIGDAGLVIKFYTGTNQSALIGFGITPPIPPQGLRFSYSFSKTNTVSLHNFSTNCGIQASGVGSNPGESRCFVVSDGIQTSTGALSTELLRAITTVQLCGNDISLFLFSPDCPSVAPIFYGRTVSEIIEIANTPVSLTQALALFNALVLFNNAFDDCRLLRRDCFVAPLAPTFAPTVSPTVAPTRTPTQFPTGAPTVSPTVAPTTEPTTIPTDAPTVAPTNTPTA